MTLIMVIPEAALTYILGSFSNSKQPGMEYLTLCCHGLLRIYLGASKLSPSVVLFLMFILSAMVYRRAP